MLPWVLLFALVAADRTSGARVLPPLPMKDGCFVLQVEADVFRVEGEAVILDFPWFHRQLVVRSFLFPTGSFHIARSNETGGVAYEGEEGRVQQRGRELWLLPAQASDSGVYTCTYRNATLCVTNNVTLQVYESGSVDVANVSYQMSLVPGQRLEMDCPLLSQFNHTEHIEWYKDPSPAALRLGAADSSYRGGVMPLVIPSVQQQHLGLYTCRLTVQVDSRPYSATCSFLLRLRVPSRPKADLPVTSAPSVSPAHGARPPVIVSPVNGSVFESAHGSGVELFCSALTDCQSADSTVVTWLVDGQSVESSYLDRRAVQGGRRVTRVQDGCQVELRLVVIAIREEDTETELKCVSQNRAGRRESVTRLRLEDSSFTWLVVGLVAVSCVLAVLSIFLWSLLRPRAKPDYMLARQSSSC
ncbi:interleukin-1 receptor type 2-like [Myripristis murdjan]|uniref:interleukin-1 receptor type 2-like n=1 Tax=Myripristis murdjan TaxID=586833 RepID=UPI001176278D|nr:interleukin-1 receptor type 2-like [Myripristis murdjan]